MQVEYHAKIFDRRMRKGLSDFSMCFDINTNLGLHTSNVDDNQAGWRRATAWLFVPDIMDEATFQLVGSMSLAGAVLWVAKRYARAGSADLDDRTLATVVRDAVERHCKNRAKMLSCLGYVIGSASPLDVLLS